MINPFRKARSAPPTTLGRFLFWCLRGAWGLITVSALLSAAAGAMEVVSAWLLGRVIDSLISTTQGDIWSDHALILGGFVLFYLVIRPVVFGLSTAANHLLLQPNIFPQVLSRLHRHTMGQSVTFFDNDFAGRIAQKQMQTARAVTDVAQGSIETGMFALSSILGSAAMLAAIDGWAALALLLWMIAMVLVIRTFLPHVRGRSKARASARAMVSGQVVDTITNIKTVKLFANTEHEDREALGAMESFRERAIAFGRVSTGYRTAQMALSGLLPVVLVGGTVLLWRQGAASAGDVAAAGAIAMRIAQMSGWVSMSLMQIYGSIGEAEDGMNTLAATHGLTDHPDAQDMGRAQGAVCFDHVSFSYGRSEGGLQDISLAIPAGQRVGIVGASGAGKSTLVALLLRLYDTEKGAVRLDNTDIRTITQESLRRQIAMVTQETAMFNRSARENILYGRPDATEQEIIDAARAAEAHDFILDLEDHKGNKGYDAMLGERGVKLSGGQRQRIALARAFLKNAPILVLDEATSALDSEVEAQVQDALTNVMADKTVLAIAHRLSTIAEMDRIVVMEKGHIAEDGTHDELLAQNGLYARYWNRQSGGFIGAEDNAEDVEAAQ
ncbi:ABC transporter ATP-binding protein [Thioclava litoralis]|uniref:ABC transporter ATP-binding protein n=1 Tax=Thioclava litoralis TaxID=3076557 RepID=A0ABZ1E1D2_9RHOB|nr:ABC transporter ATP-binding protein [Thioclava sp. FTW29]